MGKLKWSELFKGAISIAENGFRVQDYFAHSLHAYRDLIKNSNLRSTFEGLKEGQILKRPDLARTLRTLSKEGAESFYRGGIAKDLLHDLKRHGSILTERDFTNYKARVSESTASYLPQGDLKLFTTQLPSSGPVLEYILNIMFGYKDLYPLEGRSSESSAALFYHRFIESLKFAYSKRTLLGDPQFDMVDKVLAELRDDDFVDATRKRIIDDRTFEPAHYGQVFAVTDNHGTAHVSVIDKEGNAVAAGSTVNLL